MALASAGNTTFQFQNLGPITGDTGIWRAGDGNPNNILSTMDGYSYAMPVAVVFQRNSGAFFLGSNVFGCADPLNANLRPACNTSLTIRAGSMPSWLTRYSPTIRWMCGRR